MIDKLLLQQTVEQALADSDLYLVDINIAPGNNICVEIDSAAGVDIDSCARITRAIEEVFDREVEDYELEVGSAGLTSPFKIRAQYEKNIGNDIEVLTRDGRKLRGVLSAVAEGAPADRDVEFTLTTTAKVKAPGAKRPELVEQQTQLNSKDCKYVRYDLKF